MTKTFGLKAQGTKIFGDGDVWIDWFLFDPNVSDEEIIEIIGREASYGGPGRMFQDSAIISRTQTRALATIRGGYDV